MSHCSPDTLTYLLIQVCKAHRAQAGSLLSALGMHSRAVQREVEGVWERLEQRVTLGLTLEERLLLRRLLLQVRDKLEARTETT